MKANPGGSITARLAGRETIGYVVDRNRLDTSVAGLAADAGAELALRTELEAALRHDPADPGRGLGPGGPAPGRAV